MYKIPVSPTPYRVFSPLYNISLPQAIGTQASLNTLIAQKKCTGFMAYDWCIGYVCNKLLLESIFWHRFSLLGEIFRHQRFCVGNLSNLLYSLWQKGFINVLKVHWFYVLNLVFELYDIFLFSCQKVFFGADFNEKFSKFAVGTGCFLNQRFFRTFFITVYGNMIQK